MRLPEDQKKFGKKISIRFFFQFFPHAGTVEENTWPFEVLLLFLSLRYGADLGRSGLFKIVIVVKMQKLGTDFQSSSKTFFTKRYSHYLDTMRV